MQVLEQVIFCHAKRVVKVVCAFRVADTARNCLSEFEVPNCNETALLQTRINQTMNLLENVCNQFVRRGMTQYYLLDQALTS